MRLRYLLIPLLLSEAYDLQIPEGSDSDPIPDMSESLQSLQPIIISPDDDMGGNDFSNDFPNNFPNNLTNV